MLNGIGNVECLYSDWFIIIIMFISHHVKTDR